MDQPHDSKLEMNWTIEYEWLVYVNKLPFDAIVRLFMKALKFET